MAMQLRHPAVAFLVGVALALTPFWSPLLAQSPVHFPSSVKLSDVRIVAQTGGGDGCYGRCIRWRILVRGDGFVELDDLGTPPRAAAAIRQINVDEVVSLVNEFLKARFLEAHDLYYYTEGSVVRNGDSLVFRGMVGGTGPYTDLTLQLGPVVKTVRLRENVPVEIQRLKDLVWQTGGPDAWERR